MQIDPAEHPYADNYKLITNLVVPRPIAWVSTVNERGLVNLAPFSFFNAMGADPPYLVFSVGVTDAGELKDTVKNILASHEFVVNMVTEDLFAAMNVSAADFPPDESELEALALHAAASVRVKPPRVAEAHASLECKLVSTQSLKGNNTMILGEVVMFHVADHLLGPRMHVNNFAPIGRLGAPSYYCRTSERLSLPRITYAQWRENKKLANT